MNAKKVYGDYYLGLDMGTSSVGWAVTDLNYNLMKFHGKQMWGVRLFDEAKTAEERRLFRANRRRNERETQRIRLLQELFADEISQTDFSFFMRLKESKYYEEDKTEQQSNTLFNDQNFKDSDYSKKYPTIYHLRKDLIENKNPHDVRLVYLALHHILKHRGHFLYSGEFSDVSELKLEPMIDELSEEILEICAYSFNCVDYETVKETVVDTNAGITNKKSKLAKCFEFDKENAKKAKAIITLMSGGSTKLSELFGDSGYKESEQDSISFKGSTYEDNEDLYRTLLLDRFNIIENLKAIYDWGVLQDVLSGEKNISFAKVKTYEEHKADLALLKAAVKEYCPDKYNAVFREQVDKACNYSAYIGNYHNKGKHIQIEKNCTQEDFCDFLRKKIFSNIEINEEKYPGLLSKIESNTLLPKQRIKDNGVIPYQVHLKELNAILNNAKEYLDFLNKTDEKGLSVSDKIESIMEYRIPYYVGPVNGAHKKDNGKGFYWAVKKSDDKVRPWNFEEVIDLEKSAENFIRRMTNKCTYLIGEDVMPKDSLLYSKYMALNELNNLRINDEKISVQLKQNIYEDVFKKYRKITGKKLREYLVTEGIINKNDDAKLSGFDMNFKSTLKAYHDFKEILGVDTFSDEQYEMIEDVIKGIVLFGDDKKILIRKVKNDWGKLLTEDQIMKIKKLKYAGWGRFSKELLTDIKEVDPVTGEIGKNSIIEALYNYEGNPNFMELLSNNYGFSAGIALRNNGKSSKKDTISYADLDDLYVSVPVKRSIWQTITIVKELTKILGHEPKKVFIEMARGAAENDKGRKQSRKNNLIDLYKACKEDCTPLFEALNDTEENKLRGDKLYLYYTQFGKCMYSGDIIDLDDLGNYDIDHIYPQSKVMDDSLDNRVLVRRELNAKKTDNYPLYPEWQEKMKPFWGMLLSKGMISEVKYKRLVRKEPFTEGELVGFVSRQIVETRQSTKAVAHMFEEMFDNTEIVYVKAGNVSRFRHGVDDYAKGRTKPEINDRVRENAFIKVREINDYHHAKDAYLNIVVGNVFNSKFTSNPYVFFKEKDNKYSFNAMYKFPVSRGGVAAWEPTTEEKEGTMEVVKKVMQSNRIQFTRYAKEIHGGFYRQQILKKGHGQIPLKGNDRISDIDKYGGYDKAAGAYFFLAEHTLKKKRVRTIEFVPVYLSKKIDGDADALINFCIEDLCLIKPRILIKKIKFDTLFEIDGFRGHLTGRTNSRLIFKNANELVLNVENEIYIKRISNLMQRMSSNKDLYLNDRDGINYNSNFKLLKQMIEKMQSSPYAVKYAGVASQIDLEVYSQFDLKKQAKVIFDILPLLQCNVLSADLTELGGGSRSGIVNYNKEISGNKSAYIVNQSTTGLFEQKIDLLAL